MCEDEVREADSEYLERGLVFATELTEGSEVTVKYVKAPLGSSRDFSFCIGTHKQCRHILVDSLYLSAATFLLLLYAPLFGNSCT